MQNNACMIAWLRSIVNQPRSRSYKIVIMVYTVPNNLPNQTTYEM